VRPALVVKKPHVVNKPHFVAPHFVAPRFAFLVFVAWITATGGCDDPPICHDGEFEACLCDTERGYRTCVDEAYGECVCNGDTPGLPGGLAEGGGGNGGAGGQPLLPFLDPCDNDEQCETMLCHVFNAKGPRCSQSCTVEGDCPPPSPGCNGMGICKAP
jgi:hypothetical protein